MVPRIPASTATKIIMKRFGLSAAGSMEKKTASQMKSANLILYGTAPINTLLFTIIVRALNLIFSKSSNSIQRQKVKKAIVSKVFAQPVKSHLYG